MHFKRALILFAALSVLIGLSNVDVAAQIPECADQNFNSDSVHFSHDRPVGPTGPDYQHVNHEIYELYNNAETKFADWVAYCIDPVIIGTRETNTYRNWKVDPELPENATLEMQDYKEAWATIHTDRGHQAPLASFRGTSMWSRTNYLSNITPQRSDLNRGSWLDLENAIRGFIKADSGHVVYVITGPVYERPMEELPCADESHQVPSGYFKIVATPDESSAVGIAAVGFFFDQETPRGAEYVEHIVAIDDIEGKTGYNFFPAIAEDSADEELLEGEMGSWPPVASELGRGIETNDELKQTDSQLDGVDDVTGGGFPAIVIFLLSAIVGFLLSFLLLRS